MTLPPAPLVLVLAFLLIPCGAAAGSRVELDTAEVRKLYLEGDFDRAIEDIERALKWDRSFSHEDSVFMYKHLGVMYAARYETREKGKHYMVQLLTVEPTARILDMYASDMIYMIFKNTQAEFEANQGRLTTDHSAPGRDSSTARDDAVRRGRGMRWIAWTVGAAAAMGGVALAAHLMEEAEASSRENIPE